MRRVPRLPRVKRAVIAPVSVALPPLSAPRSDGLITSASSGPAVDDVAAGVGRAHDQLAAARLQRGRAQRLAVGELRQGEAKRSCTPRRASVWTPPPSAL